MKHRILSFLKALAAGKDPDLLEQIVDETKGSEHELKSDYVKKQASRVYSNMLHDYGRFEVSTLDSFFVRTVKSIAKELGLPINFEIELDHDKTMEAMVEKLFEEAKDNKALRKWLNKYAHHKMSENKSWQIKRDIFSDGKQVFSEKYHQANKDRVGHQAKKGERALADIIDDAQKNSARIKQMAKEQCEKALNLIDKNGLTRSDFPVAVYDVFARRENVYETSPNQTFRDTVAGHKTWFKKTTAKAKQPIIEGISRELSGFGQSILDEEALYSTYGSFLKKIFIYGILDYLHSLLVAYRDEKNLLLLSDLSALLSNLIGENDAPFIFEKAGSKYQHIFIDEFQDTSDLQWKNVLPLVLNALGSSGNEVLIVGDVKQSIYRWRGGNLNLLLSKIQIDLQSAYKPSVSDQTLDTNYRSDELIVKFNNLLFTHLRDNIARYAGSERGALFPVAYKEIAQKPKKGIGQGFVSIDFIESKSDYQEEMAEWLVNSINDCIKDDFTYRDMLILVETKADALLTAQILLEYKIPIITDRSLLLRNSEKVLFLISCAQWLTNSKNQVAQCQLLYLYQIIFNKELELHPTFDVGRKNWLDDFSKRLPEGFMDQIDSWKSKPVYEAIEDIIYFFGLQNKADAFIQKFQDELLLLMESGETSMEDMLKWWEANRDELSIGAPDSAEAIQIMTVHKSKGLESPVVFFPYSKKAYNSRGLFWTDQIPERFSDFKLLPLDFGSKLKDNEFNPAYELELSESILERLNVHYVAFTRAKNRLYVCGKFNPDPKKKPEDGNINTLEKVLLESLEKLEIGELETDNVNQYFRFGSPTKKPKAKEDEDYVEVKELRAYPSHPYTSKLQLKQGSKRFFELREEGLESERQRGLIIHSLLEVLDQPENLEQQIEKLQNEGIINAEEVSFVRDTFEGLMEDKTFQSFFDPSWEAFVEREILLKGKSYRPDRVICKGTEAKVIDYKSEIQKPDHQKQVLRYAELLKQMGYTKIEKYLVYTISKEIVKVSWADL